METKNTSTALDAQDTLDDLRITLQQAKAVAEAFSILYIDSSDANRRILEIVASPDRHCDLYSVLEDLLSEANRLAESIML